MYYVTLAKLLNLYEPSIISRVTSSHSYNCPWVEQGERKECQLQAASKDSPFLKGTRFLCQHLCIFTSPHRNEAYTQFVLAEFVKKNPPKLLNSATHYCK